MQEETNAALSGWIQQISIQQKGEEKLYGIVFATLGCHVWLMAMSTLGVQHAAIGAKEPIALLKCS